MERLVSRLSRVVRKVGDSAIPTVVETVRWVEYPFTAPVSRLVVIGRSGESKKGESFLLEIRVRVTSISVSWTCMDGQEEGRTTTTNELEHLMDFETYLERKFGTSPSSFPSMKRSSKQK
jgi:hypothetical protein